MKLTPILSVFLSLAIITQGAPVNFSKRRFGNESSPKAVAIFQEIRSTTKGTDKEAEGADLSVKAIEALFVDAPACDQQDRADDIIDLGRSLGGKKEKKLIDVAKTYRQLERNTPDGQSSELCTKQPRNTEINGLLQAQESPNEPDPDDPSTVTPNEPDPDDPSTVTPNEPDPDDPSTVTPNEPDPDDPSTVTPNEPDPDDPSTVTPNEPDPDDPSTVTPNEPDPDDPSTVTPNEPDPDDPSTATPNEPDPDDPSIVTPNEPDPDDPSTITPNEPDPDEPDGSGDDKVLPKDSDEDSEHNDNGSSSIKSKIPQGFA